MEKKEMRDVWNRLCAAYKETIVCGPFGLTGDPRKTIAAVFDKEVSYDELAETLAVIAMLKRHDGRFSRENRKWLTGFIDSEDADKWQNDYDNLYREYVRALNDVDRIHTAHLDNLVQALRTEPEFAKLHKQKKTFFVPCTYTMCGTVAVTGDFKDSEEAVRWAIENIEHIRLPKDAEYLCGSFEIDETGIVLDENGDIAD